MPELMTVAQVARHLGVCPDTVYKWRAMGYGPTPTRIGDGPRPRLRYRRCDVEAYLTARREDAEAAHAAG